MRVVVEAVSKTFTARAGREIEALHDVSLAFEGGEFITVLGPSGCGKSTLLHILAGLIPPTRGGVVFQGLPERTPVTSIVSGPSGGRGTARGAATRAAPSTCSGAARPRSS
ncbi:MAG: ATP-binding cassette domain-containing protein [Candidatus Rokubacteria bacterium]|nr:ATP-binding cassette domain-containing protein [Candidatus Rokubacteria bacterium]